jgi:hypothetical protein
MIGSPGCSWLTSASSTWRSPSSSALAATAGDRTADDRAWIGRAGGSGTCYLMAGLIGDRVRELQAGALVPDRHLFCGSSRAKSSAGARNDLVIAIATHHPGTGAA